ncbi:MAG: ankyrin repeat domain-containing protein [Verrucomicrobia bacterium]|nr:ankyrin repeat domain-containing protein [Verrucomicrobiota bacterium]
MAPELDLVQAYHWGHWVAVTALAATLVPGASGGMSSPPPAYVCTAPAGHDIHAACYQADVSTVENMLNDNPALLYMRALDGRTLLHFAASSGSPVLVELLLARGMPVDARDNFGITPLHVAAAKGNVDVAEALVRHGAEVNARHRYGKTPLATAMAMDSKPLVALLMQCGGTE